MTVYVSGLSERKRNAPPASVVELALCEGDVALTRAPATGALPAESTMRPTIVPVVPACAGTGRNDSANSTATMTAAAERPIHLMPPLYAELRSVPPDLRPIS